MPPLVHIPVACCPSCFASHTLAGWRALELLDNDEATGIEHRRCQCGARLSFAVDDIDPRDLTMPADQYEKLFPGSELPRLARLEHAQRARRRLVMVAASAAVSAAAVAATLAYLLIG